MPVRDVPVYIGSSGHCQIRVPLVDDQDSIEIVVWQRDGELLLRSLRRKVQIGGREWTWAVLEHGDQIRCNGLHIVVELPGRSEGPVGSEVERDRRTAHRLKIDAPGLILGAAPASAGGAEVRVKDIGDGGGQIDMRYRPSVGERLQLRFRPPPDNEEVFVSLVVIATSETGDASFPFAAHCQLAEEGRDHA